MSKSLTGLAKVLFPTRLPAAYLIAPALDATWTLCQMLAATVVAAAPWSQMEDLAISATGRGRALCPQ